MFHRAAMVCGGVLVCATVGCLPLSFLAPREAHGYKQVVPLPPAQVAAMLNTGLTDAGIRVMSKRTDKETRLAGQGKSGKVFCLYVRAEAGDAEKTTVTVHWDDGVDDVLWQTVVGLLAVDPAPQDASSTK